MWKRTIEKRNEGGFTLIELLIVIIILAILAAIVVFAVGTTSSNAKVAACQSDAKTFETAIESYKGIVGYYPGDPTLTTTATSQVTQGQTWANAIVAVVGPPATGPVFGLLGNNGTPATGAAVTPSAGNTWPDPLNTQITVGPFMRQLPSNTHYQIWTDGLGGVFIYSPKGNGTGAAGTDTPGTSTTAMDAQTQNNFDNPANSNLCNQVSV